MSSKQDQLVTFVSVLTVLFERSLAAQSGLTNAQLHTRTIAGSSAGGCAQRPGVDVVLGSHRRRLSGTVCKMASRTLYGETRLSGTQQAPACCYLLLSSLGQTVILLILALRKWPGRLRTLFFKHSDTALHQAPNETHPRPVQATNTRAQHRRRRISRVHFTSDRDPFS